MNEIYTVKLWGDDILFLLLTYYISFNCSVVEQTTGTFHLFGV